MSLNCSEPIPSRPDADRDVPSKQSSRAEVF